MSTLILLVIASIASILTILIYSSYNYTEFFSLLSSFSLLFSLTFVGFSIYYYRYDVPEDKPIRNPYFK
jgi:hypothetical protein